MSCPFRTSAAKSTGSGCAKQKSYLETPTATSWMSFTLSHRRSKSNTLPQKIGWCPHTIPQPAREHKWQLHSHPFLAGLGADRGVAVSVEPRLIWISME